MKSIKIAESGQLIRQQAAASRRDTPNLSLRQLMQKPEFTGFVDVDFLQDIQVCMFVCANDDGIALRCLWNGTFEPMSLALWSVLARQAGCVIDIGAHTGIYSLIAHASAPASGPAPQVISFEPYALNFARLSMNLRANGFATELTVQSALADKEQIMPFTIPANAWYLTTGGSLTPKDGTRRVPVNCSSLDIIAARRPMQPDLIKIDVEGHELQVLQGAAGVLNAQLPDLIIESVFNDDTSAIEDLLRGRGYRFYGIEDDTCRLHATDHLRPASTDAINMDRCNRFVTRRSAEEVAGLAKAAAALVH